MTQIVSSISGIEIYAPSAGNAPTNSADVSAIASAYQVVSATGTQLYAGTAHVTSINSTPISASRAGNAANASMANSAYYDGTGRLLSSLPDSAAVSAIASAYATAKVDKSSISAQSSNWNSVYNTVSNNSASWSGSTGGGGNVTSPSGTIFVKDGTAIEGTNSAVVVDQTSVGKTSILPIQGYAIGPTGMGVLTYGNLDESGMNLVFMLAGEYHGDDATVIISGRDYNWNFASASGLIVEGDTSANIPLGTVQSQLSASSYYWINLLNSDLSGVKAPGYAVTSVGELAWKSAVDNVTNTVSSNSASWGGGGGVDSATVSSIASSYATSSVSGVENTVSSNSASWAQGLKYGDKVSNGSNTIGLGKSANTNTDAGIYLSSTHGSGFYKVNELTLNRTGYGETVNFNLGSAGSQVRVSASGSRGGYYSAWNDNTSAALMVSGTEPILKLGSETATDSSISYWNECYDTVSANSASWTTDLTDYATTAYVDSSVSSKLDSSASSSFYTTANESGFVDSSYVDSSVSSKADSSALSSYALSADVSGTVDLVSSQSANWGGSALALSAGPGVKLEMVGSTLVASVDGPLHRQETLAGYWNGNAVYQQFISGTATSNGNTNFSIPAEITGTNIVNKWIDPSHSFIYYNTTSNALPISWCLGSGRYGSVGFVGGVINYRCIDTSPTTITAYIALKYMKA